MDFDQVTVNGVNSNSDAAVGRGSCMDWNLQAEQNTLMIYRLKPGKQTEQLTVYDNLLIIKDTDTCSPHPIANCERKEPFMGELRTIHTDTIKETIKKLFCDANYILTEDMQKAFDEAQARETQVLGKKILADLQLNMKLAKEQMIPICQDTGMAILFMEIGQDVHITGENLADAVNEGVRDAYVEGYLRKSVVSDPLLRVNTNDNTPAILHTSIVPGNQITIKVAPKGFGSENMSRLFMLKPADGVEGVKKAILSTVLEAGPNACPPFVVGVGIGGDFEKSALMAKYALTREVGSHSPLPHIASLEEELLDAINRSGIGPAGLGGNTTALSVNIETFATHIAGLPLAVNMCCHVCRHRTAVI